MEFQDIIEQNRAAMIQSLQELMRIRSVRADACRKENGTLLPFGSEVEQAYQYVLELGRNMGFEVKDADHFGGHIQWRAEDPDAEIFGIAGHLDVVPEGEGWSVDPFEAKLSEDWILGRGAQDDKGPVIACLYGMKALQEAGLTPTRTIRLIIGLDEETEQEGMRYYLEQEGMPDLGITPDGEFPLTNGEMGNLEIQLASRMKKYSPKDGLVLSKMQGGIAPNVVPGSARAVVSAGSKEIYGNIRSLAEDFTQETGYDIKTKRVGSSLAIEATGISAHGADPHLGLNAISVLMAFLGKLSFVGDEISEWIQYYNQKIGFHLHGENLDCELEDEPSGKLVCNVGMMEVGSDVATALLNIRYPVTYTSEDVYRGIEKSMEGTAIGLIKVEDAHPVYTPVDDPFVQELLSVYREESGDQTSQPFVDRGGTYAKLLRHTVAFGALFPGDEDRMHQPDERIQVDTLVKLARIYGLMMYRLCIQQPSDGQQ